MMGFEQQAPILTQEHTEPTRAPSVAADVWVPLCQSAATGAITGLLFVMIALWAAARLTPREWALLWAIPCAMVMSIMWLIRLQWADSTIMKVESFLQTDLNRDGAVGPPHAMSVNHQPPPQAATIQRERERLEAFIHACYRVGTATRGLRSQGFTDAEISRFRALLLRPDVGLARWRTRSQKDGWLLTEPLPQTLVAINRLVWLPPRPGGTGMEGP